MTSINILSIMAGVVFMVGCSTKGNAERYACQSACQIEYQNTLKECTYLVSHENRPLIRDQIMQHCLVKKRFPQGSETCANRCQ